LEQEMFGQEDWAENVWTGMWTDNVG